MQVLAPAKINLHLRVGKRRDDGFHPLLTWMCTVGLFDKLIVKRATTSQFTCSDPSLPTTPSNLVLKAALAIAPHTPLALHLEKQIPHGAGLGGGSSDAARTLLAINSLLALNLPRTELQSLSSTLGSDIPFFFHHPRALCQGRGEIVTSTPPPLPMYPVLLMPGTLMPTPDVYRRFDELHLGSDLSPHDADFTSWSRFNSLQLLDHLVNDLETPAWSLDPNLRILHEKMTQIVSRPSRLSGSGSTLFTLFDHREEAVIAAQHLSTALRLRAIPVELAPMIRDDLHEDRATQ